MKDWHRVDIFAALAERGWSSPSPHQILPEESGYVGEAFSFERKDEAIELYFVADFGAGFDGPQSVEAVHAKPSGDELWLHRTRDSKWIRALAFWANRVSKMPLPEGREPNRPPRV